MDFTSNKMKTFVLFCFAVFIFGVKVECLDNKCTISNTSRIFLDNFVSNFSGTDTISLDRLKTIVYTSAFSNKTVNITTCSGFSEEKERKECLLNHVSLFSRNNLIPYFVFMFMWDYFINFKCSFNILF